MEDIYIPTERYGIIAVKSGDDYAIVSHGNYQELSDIFSIICKDYESDSIKLFEINKNEALELIEDAVKVKDKVAKLFEKEQDSNDMVSFISEDT